LFSQEAFMKIKPLNDWVVIQAAEAEQKTAGGIIIPEVAKEKPQWGVVVSAGPGAYRSEKEKGKEKEKKFVATEVVPGDRVLYERYMASEFDLDGNKVIMVREANILGRFESHAAPAPAKEKNQAKAAPKPKKAAAAKTAAKTAKPRK
jgi:chaperonin GroES